MINKLIIYQYINKLKKDDIYKFGINEGINLDNNELDLIYKYIKNDYKRIINNPDEVLIEIRDKVNNDTYNKILEFYDKYRDYIDKIK